MRKKILFLSSDDIALNTILALHQQYDITVVSKADKPKKRSGQAQANVLVEALKKDPAGQLIPIIKISQKEKEWWQQWSADQFSAVITFSFGMILPADFLDYWHMPTINIHPSLLPQWRGPSPLQAALLHNQNHTALTYMLMSAGMDEGDILRQIKFSIDPDWTILKLRQAVAKLSEVSIIPFLQDWQANKIIAIRQDNNQATYCSMISKDDGRIDWQQSAEDIYNQYRAYINWPGVFTTWQNKLLFLRNIRPIETTLDNLPGQVTLTKDKKVQISCGQGAIEVLELQLAGKKKLAADDFLRGHATFIHARLI
ncbi:MAG: methionyl-tRNA formyltransferase [Candidatus Komeilibacteria bacterium]